MTLPHPANSRGAAFRTHPLAPYWRAMGTAVRTAKAAGFSDALMPLLRYLKLERGWSYSQIAEEFNARGMKTQRGQAWSGQTVQNMLNRH